MTTVIERASHSTRRVVQTVRRFDNWPHLLRGLVTGRPAELVFQIDGHAVACPNRAGARVPVYEVFAEDAYRLPWFTEGLGENASVLDIGAHIGCFSLALTSLRPDLTVEAFEASPATGEYLDRNVVSHGREETIRRHHVAVSDHAGVLVVADNGAGSGHNGVLHLSDDGTRSLEVPAISLAEAFQRARGTVELVKIDVEGAEYDMILASSPELWAGVSRVVMEYHDMPGHDWAELEAFFSAVGLEVVRREEFTSRLGQAWLSRGPLT